MYLDCFILLLIQAFHIGADTRHHWLWAKWYRAQLSLSNY